MDIYEIFQKLKINYQEIEHPKLYTIADTKKIKNKIQETGCKNLFLTDGKENFYLVILREDKMADFKKLNQLVGHHLSFGKEEQLKKILNLEKGSCTPFGILYDKENKVKLLIDQDLKDKILLFHPNTNTKTVSIAYKDLLKIIEYFKHHYQLI